MESSHYLVTASPSRWTLRSYQDLAHLRADVMEHGKRRAEGNEPADKAGKGEVVVNLPPKPNRRESSHHHHSHRRLLSPTPAVESASIDAIIVPTARTSAYLWQSIAIAQHHKCILVLLCSGLASAKEAIKLVTKMEVETVAINIQDIPDELMPSFQTSALLRGTKFSRQSDVSQKRNLGLLFAHMANWNRIVFLDDDITVPLPEDLNAAVGLLNRYAGVGLSVGGFPDNSIVCHAFRDAGGAQDTFIGGGALAVGRESFTSFFPNIYNEDWFFLLNETGLRPSTVAGKVIQARYDPYRDDTRARSEELGDSLAEGLFSLLDNGMRLTDADAKYWVKFLHRRRRFIDEVIDMVATTVPGGAQKDRMTAALKAARGRNLLIDPQMCVDYMTAWQADRKLWERYIQVQPPGGIEKLLAELGLMHCYREAA